MVAKSSWLWQFEHPSQLAAAAGVVQLMLKEVRFCMVYFSHSSLTERGRSLNEMR